MVAAHSIGRARSLAPRQPEADGPARFGARLALVLACFQFWPWGCWPVDARTCQRLPVAVLDLGVYAWSASLSSLGLRDLRAAEARTGPPSIAPPRPRPPARPRR